MRFWVRLLPLFVVVWLARKLLAVELLNDNIVSIQGQQWYLAFEDIIIKVVK